MEAEVKEVMDGLFGGNITFQEALEQLSVSEDELHKMLDGYEYTPTTEDILENNRMILEELEYIEREISVNCRRGISQNVGLTNAAGVFESPPKGYTATDVTEVIKSKDSIIPTANGPHDPHGFGYIW